MTQKPKCFKQDGYYIFARLSAVPKVPLLTAVLTEKLGVEATPLHYLSTVVGTVFGGEPTVWIATFSAWPASDPGLPIPEIVCVEGKRWDVVARLASKPNRIFGPHDSHVLMSRAADPIDVETAINTWKEEISKT